MKKAQQIILKGSKLKYSSIHKLDLIVRKKKQTIIKGIVYDENNEPAIGATIEVRQINCITGKSNVLGYCFTNYKGEYIFSIRPLKKIHYEISIYSPLSIY